MNAKLTCLLREGRWVQPTSATGVLGIGAAAFLLSYDALHSLALASGVRPGLEPTNPAFPKYSAGSSAPGSDLRQGSTRMPSWSGP